MSEQLYKVLGAGRRAYHDGKGVWKRPGVWMPRIEDIALCIRGYHLVTLTQLPDWLGPEIWTAEGRGESLNDASKSVWQSARLVRKTNWDRKSARLFAADCAERVLPIYEAACPNDDRPRKAIEAARSGNAKQRAAAGAAAGDAERQWQVTRLETYL